MHDGRRPFDARSIAQTSAGSFVAATSRVVATHVRRHGQSVIIAAVLAWSIVAGATAQASPSSSRLHVVSTSSVETFAGSVSEAAHRFDIPEHWIYAVIRIESGGDRRARSPKGAIGLMQIMPETWRDLRARYGLGADPFDPHDNILAGAAYLRELHDRYGSPGFLAAYNAGPGRYERHLATGRPLPDETRAYVAKLQSAVAGVQAQRPVDAVRAAAFSHVNLFVPRGSQRMAGGHPSVIGKRLDRSSAGARRVNLSPLLPRPNSLFARHADENLWR
ncbi:MAG: lytic transglycosylase domain-containing protein [Bradyrhizobium sp.]|uniref:lytic transglycosylase domain-containing protein n=1 Tax=Bradyrhizobium TaxID=374 RepID=UPI001FE60AED|nr:MULTISPECIES: lytic transglycosylase domain-containing protein [Bradyrhizobium]MDU0955403.1 lytic transglycosylase domain-containing protein [Bradyrhizobium sp.]MDU3039694.1 lytic transglycosylase domain-containing protein [Bradyrhizobium sp.]MDU6242899.1 lytic transglycosylase domain-containing protein [Bradyrhizobium sp.]MDU6492351.1 lytic transglycosylase domain-containing protein [Bradyrhizobium sp.]MDU6725442.1 lytic transglycosylase domain-containing protein [Bradyrhizobium sp.]